MFNYHGMKVLLPTDTPESIKISKANRTKTLLEVNFANREIKMKDKNGKVVKTNKVPYITSYPNRETKRHNKKMAGRLRNDGHTPVGYSKKEYQRMLYEASQKEEE